MNFLYIVLGLLGVITLSKKDEILEKIDNTTDEFSRFDSLFKKYGEQYGVDPLILKAICLNESNLGREKSVAEGLKNPNNIEGSKSSDGLSWGLMQVTLTTARDFDLSATPQKLNNPDYSVMLAARLMKQNMAKFAIVDNRWLEWVVKSYNQGAGNTNKERRGEIRGYAQAYWERFQRNLQRVKDSL